MRERVAGKREGRGGGAPHRDLVIQTCITMYVLYIYVYIYRKYMCVEEIYTVKVHGLNKRCVDDFEEMVFESVRDILELSYSEVTSLNSHA